MTLENAVINNGGLKQYASSVTGVDKTWARAHGLAHELPFGLPYFDDFTISQFSSHLEEFLGKN